MVILFALKIFIVAWKWALRASRRFSLRALKILTACSFALLILSCWGWYEARRIDEYEVRYRALRIDKSEARYRALLSDESYWSARLTYPNGFSLEEWRMGTGGDGFVACIMFGAHGGPYYEVKLYQGPTYDPFDPRELFRQIPVNLVQVSAPERHDFQHSILFWLSVIGMVVSPISTIATLLFTWITLHRRRAEELLMRLEMEKHRLRIEQLRLELERARREHEESAAAAPRIILLS
jgi:hypothetical protein